MKAAENILTMHLNKSLQFVEEKHVEIRSLFEREKELKIEIAEIETKIAELRTALRKLSEVQR